MAQDDYYYEIQLTNKQLVFYFMAGAAGLVLSFLAGVMVGRGIDSGPAAAGAEPARPVVEEKVVTEQTPSPTPTDYSYPQRLESEKPPEGLEKPATGAAPVRPGLIPASTPAAAKPTPAPLRPTPAAPKATPPPPAATPAPTPHAVAHPVAPPSGGLPRPIGSTPATKGFAVQVGAFKDRASAESVVKSLKGRSLPAYSVGSAGLFTVRVGVYRDRADAEAVLGRLRDDKFKPYIIKQ